ncbi:MAG: hypothetical protein HY429_04410, partial [Candidatus Levybacteria bacterium]|nr:hypothetical protein [Candidatus Levybacteria bacterium]
MKKKASKVFVPVRERLKAYREKTLVFIDRRPLASFFALLGSIVLLIVLNNFLSKPPKATVEKATVVKRVQVYRIGTAPKITVQAKVVKSGVIQIVALSSGVVNKIHHFEGETVDKGTLLVSMSSNYQGGNALSLQRQIAAAQYNNINETHPTQKEIIQKQRNLASKADENSDQMRAITAESIEETKSLITLNEAILKTLDQNIDTLTKTATDAALLLATKQQKSQFLASTNAVKAQLRQTEQSSGGDNPPAQISDLQREIALKQLEVQEKQLDLSLEIAKLQLLIAQVNEGLMLPAAPFSGTVQRVLVKEKQAVTPGTPLFIFSQVVQEDPITAVAFVSHDTVKRVSRLEPSTLHIGSSTFEVFPSFISTEAVEGTLYAVYYPIPDGFNSKLISDGYIFADIPVGYFDTSTIAAFIPLDAVYQTRETSY